MFEQGIIVSASFLVRLYDEPGMAANLMGEYGITKQTLNKIADDYDKKILLPLFESELILR